MSAWKIYTPHPGVEYWYDRHVRVWYARLLDAEGNQIGAAIDAYTRGGIVDFALDLAMDAARESATGEPK